jgi:succinate dehydrogenase / fumarate reductase cytochrome b subunit
MRSFMDRHYFMLRRLNSILGIVPVGAFFLMHMALNSRAGQGPEQYQWVPDTLDQIPYLFFVEVFGILLPIALHGALGLWIALRSDYHAPRPARRWYEDIAYKLQRFTGIALMALLIVHVYQTWWQHLGIKMDNARTGAEREYDIYGSMHSLLDNPLWLAIYALFVLIAAYHFANGIYNVAFKFGWTTSTPSMRWAIAIGAAVGLIGVILGFTSLWGFSFSEWAQTWGGGHYNAVR